jgi:YggT family protein
MNQTYNYDIATGAVPPSQALMTIAGIAATLLSLYSMLIWIRIVLTWIKIPGQTQENGLARMLGKIVDPYLAWFRGIASLRRSRIDLTPLVALAVLSVVQSMLRMFGIYGRLTVGMVLALALRTIWGYIVSPILWLVLILLVLRLVFCYKRGPNTIRYIKMLDSMIGGVIDWVQGLFYSRKAVNDRQLIATALIFFVVIYFGAAALVGFAASALTAL